jgi:hypothetical protein
MGAVSTSLEEQARTIFADLGYRVSTDGGELRAERKWRTVHVTPTVDASSPPETGDFRCFVTVQDRIEDLEGALTRLNPDYEWAIIGVDEDDGYEVARPPSTA